MAVSYISYISKYTGHFDQKAFITCSSKVLVMQQEVNLVDKARFMWYVVKNDQ